MELVRVIERNFTLNSDYKIFATENSVAKETTEVVITKKLLC
jgi:hypothetical protein